MNHTGKISRLTPYHGKDSLYVDDGNSLDITHVSEGLIDTKEGSLKLNNILIVLEIKKNLLSVSQLTHDNACIIIFTANEFSIEDLQARMTAKAPFSSRKFSTLSKIQNMKIFNVF